MTILKFLSNNDSINFDDNVLYITFSKAIYINNKQRNNIIYFFDIDHNVNEKEISSLIEKNLFEEYKINSNEYYPLTFKYIYRYFITYTQFYNRLDYIIKKYNKIKSIEYSINISFIFTNAVNTICRKYSIKSKPINEQFIGFSWRHSNEISSDIIPEIDKHSFFIYLYAKYLKFINHKVFILPSSFMTKLPSSINFLRFSIFNIFNKLKVILRIKRLNNDMTGLTKMDFAKDIRYVYKLDNKIWNGYREDQIKLIEHTINIFFDRLTPEYISSLKLKITQLLKWSNTKCVILDETIDAFRRLISLSCESLKIDVEYMPHGIISEKLQFTYTSDDQYIRKYIPKTLAWNSYSSTCIKKMNLNSYPISFPIAISSHKKSDPGDILVLLSHGDLINLNQFEEDIIKILKLVDYKKNKIAWKTHHNTYINCVETMNNQKEYIEKLFNIKLNFINNTQKVSSIMKNYRLIIFTTYTTGIYEAALLNVPFIIYSKEDEEPYGLIPSKMPIANNETDFIQLMNSDNKEYLYLIRKSLSENISLNDYLSNKYA